MNRRTLDAAVAKGLQYLNKQQNSDGGFTSYSSSERSPFKAGYSYRTTFVPALVLGAISGLEAAMPLRQKLATFLRQQQSPQHSFNYWSRTSAEAQARPYPDDLDDTFCSLSALVRHTGEADHADLAAAVKLLLATETKPGGPYRTWLVSPDSKKVWLDTDVAVNANVADYLALANEPLPPLCAWLDRLILSGRLSSPYYPSDIPILYYLARNYHGRHKARLVELVKQHLIIAHTTLDRALLLSSLLRLEPESVQARAIQKLVGEQAADGSWPAAAFCIDPARDGITFYHGAEVLTTASVLEALWLRQASNTHARSATSKEPARPILHTLKADAMSLPPDLRRSLVGMASKIADSSSGHETTGLPYLFNGSLHKPIRKTSLLPKLALANLYGWTAYTIYDDFMDQEGQPQLLPAANAAHRRSLHLFEAAMDPAFVRQVFDAIDGANAWELQRCRAKISKGKLELQTLPRFGRRQKLAERSLGHLLGPIAILQAAGFEPASAKSRQVQNGLRHYLIARQLNDDMHDWQADIARGQLTYVVTELLKAEASKSDELNVSERLPSLQRKFWDETILDLCATTRSHLRRSRQQLERSGLFGKDCVLYELFDRLEVSVQEAIASQQQAKQFLEQYRTIR